MVHENLLMVNYELQDDKDAKQCKSNLAVAAFVTAYARLELYYLMEEIERIRPYSLLYTDTDSIHYVREYMDQVIETEDFLGDLTDEKTYPGY